MTNGLNDMFRQVPGASRQLVLLDDDVICRCLRTLADRVEEETGRILRANARDLARMDEQDPKYDRLKLTPSRIQGIAGGIRQVAALPSPVGAVLSESVRPNGLRLRKVRVPFGVIGVIYEARPNVTLDVFSLCFRSGNACILKGGSDAEYSNKAMTELIHEVLEQHGVNPQTVALMPSSREATRALLHADRYVDLIIPRGSAALIRFVREEATVPVIETGAGICHTYFDCSASLEKGKAIVHNAKTRRVSVCNALDCLLVHRDRLCHLPELCAPLAAERVLVYADDPALEVLRGHYPDQLLLPADENSYGTEFLDYKMAVRTVAGMDEALQHIARYSSRHSECIVAEDDCAAARFTRCVDAACVYVNAPTSFTDGGEFGLGAEVGISTQKLHARGPMGICELTTYKWIVEGDGQIRMG